MPEEIFKKIKRNISPQLKICFFAAIVAGFVGHLYKITNWLPNWDSLVFRYDAQNMIEIGRWFLPIVCAPSSFYDLPLLCGLLAILFHAFGAMCICKMFNIKKSIPAAFIGALVVTFPAVTSVIMYNYVADGYSVAFFLSCLAAMNMTNEKPNYVLSAILIALSFGIYQAYITVTIMLLLCYLIINLPEKNSSIRCIIVNCAKYLITGIFGAVIYYLILNILLKITGIELLEYQGVNSALSLSNINILNSIYVIKHSFVDYFFNFSNGVNVFSVINVMVFLLTAVLIIINIYINKPGFFKIALICVFIFLMPVCASILAFINSCVDYHNLMKMGFCAFYLLFIIMYEKTKLECARKNATKSWAIFILAAILIINQTVIANVSYHKLQLSYEKSYGVLIRIADRIEQTEGSEKCRNVLVIGALDGSKPYSSLLPPDMTGTTDGYILRADDEVVFESVLCSALNDYCGKNYNFVLSDEKEEFLNKNNIDNLGVWPSKNSIQVINETIVIKLGAESE